MIEVTLNRIEQRLARAVAQGRHDANRAAGVPDKRVVQGDLDLEGAAGEIAFCKLFNVFPDLETNQPRGSAYDAGDALYKGLRVDVKSTTYRSGHLLVARWKAPTVDVYALMVGTFPTYQFAGFISAEDAADPAFTGDLGRGECQKVPQDALEMAV